MAIASAAEDKEAAVLRQDQQVNPDGSYQYSWETDNNIKVEEQGALKKIGEEEAIVSVVLLWWKLVKCLRINCFYRISFRFDHALLSNSTTESLFSYR